MEMRMILRKGASDGEIDKDKEKLILFLL